ncbi:MAG: multiheme c-type cytochrome [Armatimonadetes bacterium]|nr:multiheme c-type cytochrome [Armatimonadota bacterium]
MRTNTMRRALVAALMVAPMLALLLLPDLGRAFGQATPKKQTKTTKTTKKAPAKPAGKPAVAPKTPAKPADKPTPGKPEATPAKPDATPAEKTEPAKPEETKPEEGKAEKTEPAKEGAAAATTGAAPANATYIGPSACQVCHADTHKSWQKKKHSSAFDLLVARKQEKNAACIKCHTTGYGRGGFVDAEKTPDLRGVTCESCHGPGSEHNGDKEKITRVPPATVCTDCHMKSNIH